MYGIKGYRTATLHYGPTTQPGKGKRDLGKWGGAMLRGEGITTHIQHFRSFSFNDASINYILGSNRLYISTISRFSIPTQRFFYFFVSQFSPCFPYHSLPFSRFP